MEKFASVQKQKYNCAFKNNRYYRVTSICGTVFGTCERDSYRFVVIAQSCVSRNFGELLEAKNLDKDLFLTTMNDGEVKYRPMPNSKKKERDKKLNELRTEELLKNAIVISSDG